MICRRLTAKTFLFGLALGTILFAVIVAGCTGDAENRDGRDSDGATGSQGISERESGDSGGERGDRREDSEEHGTGGDGGGGESREAAMSSPIIPLGQSWNGVLGGLAVSMRYDAATRTVHGTVRNTFSEKLCYVQAEPHLKSGTRTLGELGPEKLGNLNPGQETTSSLSVASEPELAGVYYDGYVVHMEVFDCSGPGPAAHTGGEGAEGSGANALAPDETFDSVRRGTRSILSYDTASNSFKGTVENTTNGVLDRVRIEVHLSNGAELGPTTPMDMAPGEVVAINLRATQASFTGWTAHAEVGTGGEGSETGGEHQGGEEHGGDRESGGEHGSGGERRGGD